MAPRERVMVDHRDGGRSGGGLWDYPGVPGAPIALRLNSCNDQVMDGDNRPLLIEHWENAGGVINLATGGYFDSWFENYVADLLRPGTPVSHLGTSSPSNEYAATKAAAATNPSRPYVDLPTAITEELRDSVFRIRDAGAGLLAQAGNANLHYQFAISPVAQDLAKLTNLNAAINARVNEIERLRTRGLRRTVPTGVYSATDIVNTYVQTAGAYFYGPFHQETTERVWVHTRWNIVENTSALSTPEKVRALATQAVLGMTVDAYTAWKLYPWSWMADWFGSIGSYLAAKRNIIPATLIEVTVMRHKRTSSTWPGGSYTTWNGRTVSCSPIAQTRETKQRAYSYVTPFAAHMPFLSGRQMGIIASLAATRR